MTSFNFIFPQGLPSSKSSASANVASTGMVTLPTMIKLGYSKRVAGAVEAVSSTGGQIMPPLMGAGAFVMVELTGIPYSQIIIAIEIIPTSPCSPNSRVSAVMLLLLLL